MDEKLNCWEVLKCGCEPGGNNTEMRGVCPAAVEENLDGSNGGRNGGRACWVVKGTMCKGAVQGTFGQKTEECMECEFYNQVRADEGAGFTFTATLLARLAGGALSDEVLESDEALTAEDILARIEAD
jgi:hypothetical protein